jgi:hypothetical protein
VAVRLLEYCNDTDEVYLLLKRKTAPDDPMAEQLKAKVFCRFAMAIECKQRKVRSSIMFSQHSPFNN